MGDQNRLHARLLSKHAEVAEQAYDTIAKVLNDRSRDILQRLYFLGPHHLYKHSIAEFTKIDAFGLVNMDGRIAFLTTAGTRFCIMAGYQDMKDTWQRNKELIRQRELKELYAVLGKVPTDETDEFQGDRG